MCIRDRVAATHLEPAAFGFIQMKEVVPLQQLVGEFREGKTVTCLTVQDVYKRQILSYYHSSFL